MEEQWETCIYNGEVLNGYEVSTMGKVRSLNYMRTGRVQELKQSKNNRGYLTVGIRNQNCLVHRLVACTFIPNYDETKTQVNHLNEDKTDNRVENLEWISHNDNQEYGTRTERISKSLSKQVICIETGVIYDNAYEVEQKTGLSRTVVASCCKHNKYSKSCGGFHWLYLDEYEQLTDDEIAKIKTHKPKQAYKPRKVRCVETGQVFDSIQQVERETGLPHGHISNCCHKKCGYKTCGGFTWEFVE